MPRSLVFLILASLSVHAHDLWVERDAAGFALQYGHERSGHTGAAVLEYAPEQVREALCHDTDGRPLKARVSRTWPVRLQADCAVSLFVFSTGYWSKTPHGTRNLPKTEAGAVFDSWLSVESVKRIDAWGEPLTRPLIEGLELVPLENPLRLKPGNKLRLAVFQAGRPAAGVTVAYFGQPRGVTDRDGRINIALRRHGLQLIQASLETPLTDGKADRRVETAALQFELPQ